MFKGHPKGLFVLAFANMGERFGYYTMLAIFALYLQAKYGLTPTKTSLIYSTFLALVYFLPLLGGLIADKFLGYGKTVLYGIIIMFFGYALLAAPSDSGNVGFYTMVGALALISIGTGLFKGNLQALVGNLYDQAQYSMKRDVAFSIFYMFINVGAFFAPSAAEAINIHFLKQDNFIYEAKVPDLSLKYINYVVLDSVQVHEKMVADGKVKVGGNFIEDTKNYKKKNSILYPSDKEKIGLELEGIGKSQLGSAYTTPMDFAKSYTKSLTRSYSWGFGVACISLVISVLIFLIFRSSYSHIDKTEKQKAKDKTNLSDIPVLSKAQMRERITALLLVFFVVIFFWMSFHQNGLCMTFFARDYTNLQVGPILGLGFNLMSLLVIIIGFYGLVTVIQNKQNKSKMIGGLVTVVSVVLIYIIYKEVIPASTGITPPIFQQFNPFFIIILTPIFIGLFSYLNKKGMEPSAPRKIGYGMLIAAIGFMILIFASLGQKPPSDLVGVSDNLISPNWLISTYFVLTLAELFLSPMGISFVSRVAPPQYKGLMQGGWFAATAIGNYLVGIMGVFWDKLPLYAFWTVLVICCLLSAIFIFSIIKRLERATTS